MAEGLTLIAVGLILLANMLGRLPWGVWWNILSLWPLLLVSAGLDTIGRGTHKAWLRVAAVLVIVGGLAYGALAMPASARESGVSPVIVIDGRESKEFTRTAPHEPAVERGRAVIRGTAGTLSVGAGTHLASARGASFYEPEFETDVSGDTADVLIGLGSGPWVLPTTGPPTRLDATLDRHVAWDLSIDTGVSRLDADLSGLTLTALEVDLGVSQGTVTLGTVDRNASPDGVPVVIDAGVSTVTLRIKKGQAVRVAAEEGLSHLSMPKGMTKVDGKGDAEVYETTSLPNHAFWDITVDSGIGNVIVEFY